MTSSRRGWTRSRCPASTGRRTCTIGPAAASRLRSGRAAAGIPRGRPLAGEAGPRPARADGHPAGHRATRPTLPPPSTPRARCRSSRRTSGSAGSCPRGRARVRKRVMGDDLRRGRLLRGARVQFVLARWRRRPAATHAGLVSVLGRRAAARLLDAPRQALGLVRAARVAPADVPAYFNEPTCARSGHDLCPVAWYSHFARVEPDGRRVLLRRLPGLRDRQREVGLDSPSVWKGEKAPLPREDRARALAHSAPAAAAATSTASGRVRATAGPSRAAAAAL